MLEIKDGWKVVKLHSNFTIRISMGIWILGNFKNSKDKLMPYRIHNLNQDKILRSKKYYDDYVYVQRLFVLLLVKYLFITYKQGIRVPIHLHCYWKYSLSFWWSLAPSISVILLSVPILIVFSWSSFVISFWRLFLNLRYQVIFSFDTRYRHLHRYLVLIIFVFILFLRVFPISFNFCPIFNFFIKFVFYLNSTFTMVCSFNHFSLIF